MASSTTFFAVAGITLLVSTASAQSNRLPLVDQFEDGQSITLQGCVKQSADSDAVLLTQIVTWPILRRSNPNRPSTFHFWLTGAETTLSESVGKTVQVEGEVRRLLTTEIETEPGLNRFGTLVAFKLPNRSIRARPESAGIDLSRVKQHADIPITLVQIQVGKVMPVLNYCIELPQH